MFVQKEAADIEKSRTERIHGTEGENTSQSNLATPRDVQSPDDRQGQDQDGKVEDDVEDAGDSKEDRTITTARLLRLTEGGADGRALKDGAKKQRDAQHDHEGSGRVDAMSDARRTEQTSREEQDGNLGQCHARGVDDRK